MFSSSDSLGALISICPIKDDNQVQIEEKSAEKNQSYSREFQAMLDSLDQEDCGEELMPKKRRLSSDQVKALERNFEIENKLEPERKVKLAEELGLQPRQVAIWFQNRRARWKTKQLERDYNVLKSNFDSLKLDYNNLQQRNEALNEKLRQLKAKICRESTESSQSVKEESPISGYESNALNQGKDSDLQDNSEKEGIKMYTDFKFKDGSLSNEVTREEKHNAEYCIGLNGSPSSSSSNSFMNWFQLSDSGGALPIKMCQTQFLRMEEQSLFSTEESCNFFSVDQAPTLHCYFSEQ